MYVIARHSKIKSAGELRAALRHNCREQYTPNADPKKTPLNGGDNVTVSGAMGKYRQLLGDHKPRKNAVHAVEYMFSASPEWFANKDRSEVLEYLRDCTNYVKAKYGAENVISVRHHFDETSPHTHVVVVPMSHGKLNAKHYLGGSKAVAQQFQHDIGKIGEKYGLQRGQEGSRATHTSIKEFQAIVAEVGGDYKKMMELIKKGRQAERTEQLNGKAMTTAAKALKEANKKAGQYHTQLDGTKAQLAETKSLLKQIKAEHAEALKAATKSHDKEALKLKKEIDQLNKQVVSLTKDRERWKQRFKKAEETADARWLEKNAEYIEKLKEDERRNRHDRRKIDETMSRIEQVESDLTEKQEKVERTFANAAESAAKVIAESATMSHDTVKLPAGVAEEVMFKNEFDEIVTRYAAKAAAKAARSAQNALESNASSDPLPTPSPEPEKRTRRKSGPTMG